VIWILLAVLGIPLWIIVGALMATLWSRHEFKQAQGVFRAKLRILNGEVAGVKDRWPRRPLFARWVHDVLVIHRGLALVRSGAHGVARAEGSLTAGDSDSVRGLGTEPLAMTLVLDSGACVQLAAPADERDVMVGPFVGVGLVADSKSSAD